MSCNRDQHQQQPLKIFLLAGQSNMVGMGSLKHLDLLVKQGANNEYSQTLWNGTAYKERDDVYMIFETHYGPLTVGRQYAGKDSFGPELMFGWTLGDALADDDDDDDNCTTPILLLKTAWGGRNLAIDFRPPSAGTGQYGDHPSHYGWEYRTMINAIHDTLGNLSSYSVPGFSSEAGYTLEGFVWFQGWNDMLDMRKVQEYGPNLAHFIRDVRLDLDAPNLPFGTLSSCFVSVCKYLFWQCFAADCDIFHCIVLCSYLVVFHHVAVPISHWRTRHAR